ncbi:translationally controlled tumor protein [Oratosquilla oratoria]|uniref:translationally controlled tumor protein n=1 Tax=Oratosquilla oratoria TaxID=337810 RepID=UPI003F772BEA
MKVFKDIISGDEMFTDSYPCEVYEEAFYRVVCKNTSVNADKIALDGANPSAEEAEEDTEDMGQSGIDVVMFMRLQETGFGSKKDFLLYMKTYLKKLKEMLEESNPEAAKQLPQIQKPLTEILKSFKDLQFFFGESMNADGMIAILDYTDINGEEKPVLYFPKLGLLEEKL